MNLEHALVHVLGFAGQSGPNFMCSLALGSQIYMEIGMETDLESKVCTAE